MAFPKTRRTRGGSNPGLTPIDDISEAHVTHLDPDTSTGRIPAQDENDDRDAKRRQPTGKKGMRKSS